MKKLFQYAVVLHTYDKDKNYVDSKIIIEPTVELAKSEQELSFMVTRKIPEEHVTQPENVQIIIKPF
jgi:hypothetical protein